MSQDFALYSKSFDSGQGIHFLATDETGKIIDEWDAPRPGGNHYYINQTRNSIGKNIRELRGNGFRKQKLSNDAYIELLQRISDTESLLRNNEQVETE